jgi:hypothetical protein
MSNQVDIFFSLLRATYGKSRYESQWPDETYEEAAKLMWAEKINKYGIAELKQALDHAVVMMSRGEKDWMWPNIGLILSGLGTKVMYTRHPSLTGREETPEEKEARIAVGKARIAGIRSMFEDKPRGPEKETQQKAGQEPEPVPFWES